jgi:8-oxo-dGTP diphosphatase
MKDHAAILLHKNNKFLFVKRSKTKKFLPNIWAFPSGTKESEESIYDTAVRESFEELGVKVEAENTIATKELPELQSRLHFVTCKIISGEPFIKDANEIQEIEWLTFNQFFSKYSDSEIGHGLIFLRQNPELWKYFEEE